MQINLDHYTEKCDHCGSPARTELVSDDRIGIEWFQFCVNPKCMQYDQNITWQREQEEQEAKESAAFARKRKRLWALESRRMHRRQRKIRMATAKMLTREVT
jgi:hypothetical protein